MSLKIGKRYLNKRLFPKEHTRAGWIYEEHVNDVALMAISGRYAMVRCKGAMPYIALVKELHPVEDSQP